MKSPSLPLSLFGFLFVLLLSCAPGLAHAYEEEAGDSMWGETINEEEHIELASNSYNHSYNYSFPQSRHGAGVPVFIFNPKIRAWAFYNADGDLIKVGKGSGGSSYCHDIKSSCYTPTGTFRVYFKLGASCKSRIFPVGKGGAPMPYCSYFHEGYAIHGSYAVRNYNASHGCIRVYPSDAKWLQSVMPIGSIVIVMPY